jgi:flagellar protein FliS
MQEDMDTLARYRKIKVATSRPEALVTILYEGAIRSLMLALDVRSDDFDSYRVNALKASSIILELIASLNFEKGGEIAVLLHGLYSFMLGEIFAASTERDDDRVRSVIDLLVPLKDTWNEAVKKHFESAADCGRKIVSCNMKA